MRSLFPLLSLLLFVSAVRAEQPPSAVESLLGRFCFDCHDKDSQEGDVDLSDYSDERTFLKDRRLWRRVVEMIEAGAMPPQSHSQPTDSERKLLLSGIRSALNDVDWAAVRAPGRVPLRRITREEFQFAAEDLFGVRIELDRMLPSDPEGISGFANDHTALVMTPKHLTRYLEAAETIAESIVDQLADSPKPIRYEVEDGTNANWKKPIAQDSDGSTGWTFSSKLGNKYQAVSKTFDISHAGRYRIRMRARSKGPGDQAAAWITVDSVGDASREVGILVQGNEADSYETELFITKGRHTIIFGYDFYGPLWLPKTPEKAQLKLGQSTFDPPPYDRTGLIPAGLELSDLRKDGINVKTDDEERATELIGMINDGYYVAVLDNLMLHKFHYEKGYLPVFLGGLGYDYQETVVPALKELAGLAQSDTKTMEKLWESTHPKAYEELKEIAKRQREAWTEQDQDRRKRVGDLYVDWIEMEWLPIDHFTPQDETGVSDYLKRVLPRGFNRPINDDDLNHFVAIYSNERGSGADHRNALKRMIVAILISPDFLYRSDGPPDDPGVKALNDHVLASRLSAFLWSSIPDEDLLQIALSKELNVDAAIDRQVDRMLDHQRRLRLARSFSEQWLNLTDIGLSKEPDKELFRYFSWRLAEDMREEVALMFDHILHENRSVLELLDSDIAHLNERLARLYGIEDVSGEEFRPVKLDDTRRGGLIGTAAVLTSTSLATRTSPVRRGQFVLETLLGVDLPSPPADVPELNDDAGQSRALSLRESLAKHRSDSRCSGCHNKIDPLGFAMENYDWIGRWRETDPAGPIDPRASLPDGKPLTGVEDLKTFLITERNDQFTAALARAMLTYALGRELEYYDEDAIHRIVAEVKADEYRSRTLVKAIARSYPFRFREIQKTSDR